MKLFGLVDCNNFYASCERVFDPTLEEKPVVILSNNDGCIIARSNEVKALGIPMGAPMFKYKDVFERYQVRVYSSNYTLYGDMSARVMGVLAFCVPKIEIYSIDEAFLDFSAFAPKDITAFAQEISDKVKQYTGIPVSVGIGSTKTLAKVANHVAKKDALKVFCLEDDSDAVLREVKIGDVWGVGNSHRQTLPQIGIHTALDLKQANPDDIRQRFSVVLMRTVKELNGISCISLEDMPTPKKATAVTRSFGKAVTEKQELIEAIATYASRGAEKLRRGKQAAMVIKVFWRTGLFDSRQPVKSWSFTVDLREHTNDNRLLVRAATDTVRQYFVPGYRLKKAGIILLELVPEFQIQGSLFSEQDRQKSLALMNVIDSINKRYGKETIRLAVTGIKPKWVMRRERRSPRYTTNWQELPIVKAKI